MKSFITLTLVFLFSFLSLTARADTYTNINGNELARIMKEEGYSVKQDSDGDVIWASEGLRWMVFVTSDGKSISALFSVNDKTTLEKINEWNRSKRFSRSYIDKDGGSNLQLDLDFEGGISKDRILDFFRTASFLRALWIKEVF